MRPAPVTCTSPTHPAATGAGRIAPRLNIAAARSVTAIELRHAGSLRRDAAAGRLPRGPAISAIRDCLRHARYTRTVAALLVAGTLMSACAQNPDAIAPVSMAGAFDGMSCQSARTALLAERQTLATLETAQRSAVTGDAVGVLLIGVPMSSLTGGDKAGLIAASKGKVLALETRLLDC